MSQQKSSQPEKACLRRSPAKKTRAPEQPIGDVLDFLFRANAPVENSLSDLEWIMLWAEIYYAQPDEAFRTRRD